MTLERAFDMARAFPESDQEIVIDMIITMAKPKKTDRDTSMRIGTGKGRFNLPDDFDDYNEEIYAEVERYALS